LFGVTTTAKSAPDAIASEAKRSTSNSKDGNVERELHNAAAGAAFAYSLNDGTGRSALLRRC